jgi:glycosyltransferase involved in cell wall biosynthesis
MARVAIVSYDAQTIRGEAGEAGLFATRLANLLRRAGEDVAIVVIHAGWAPGSVDAHWRARYRADGISLIELQSPPASATRWPDVSSMRSAEIAAPILGGFDIVYCQDRGNPAFHLLRTRRYTAKHYTAKRGPVCVTVLNGPSEWQLSSNEHYPELPTDLHLAYVERYAARHSDLVVSPSSYMVEHLRGIGWELPDRVEVLGLPMPAPAKATESPATAQIRTVVYLGAIEERKGIRNFVLALQHLAKIAPERPEVVLLGRMIDPNLLDFALLGLKSSGFSVTQVSSLDNEATSDYLKKNAAEILCVVSARSDNHPYSVVEASLVPGLNLVACRGGGIAELFDGGDAQLCDPYPMDLAKLIVERLRQPLAPSELARYDCRAANDRWLAFHRKALQSAPPSAAPPPAKPSVDVCVAYYRKPKQFGQLLDALERQTETDFHVIAVNDGSPDEESNQVFAKHADRLASRGWDFFTQENAFVDAARNNAARRGRSEFILFIDADDVPAHNAVARMREAIALSGDDALVCASYLFASDKPPLDPATGNPAVPPYAVSIPLGMDLVGGLIDPAVFGGSMCIVRRKIFEAIGGFRELRGAGHEDWELYVRLALAGYKIDILPELLQYYRQVEGSLARSLSPDAARRRLIGAYEERLAAAGLPGGALALSGLFFSAKRMESKIKTLSAKLDAPTGNYSFFSRDTHTFDAKAVSVDRLRAWYRHTFSLEARLNFHRIFLAPFIGPYKPPSA